MSSPGSPIERLGPEIPLPLPKQFSNPESYVESLLRFSTSSEILQTLCGGVHILDFFTRTPDLYSQILPEQWRIWFKDVEIHDILDLLMRENLDQFVSSQDEEHDLNPPKWRGVSKPPSTLISYIKEVRSHLLDRDFTSNLSQSTQKLDRYTSIGMNVKKAHEVSNFALYVDSLTTKLSANKRRKISHLIDFGAGQNYLGRALASHPYNRDIIAIESRSHVVDGARRMDVASKLVERELVIVNKKAFRASRMEKAKQSPKSADVSTSVRAEESIVNADQKELPKKVKAERNPNFLPTGHGTVQYVEHRILDGNLQDVIQKIPKPEDIQVLMTSDNLERRSLEEPGQMVISLHSCGNLLHHGLRTIKLNPSVQAVALVGCCYNLVTERLGPPTFKLPALRRDHPRLEATGNTCDPHGFPMSQKFLEYRRPVVQFPTANDDNEAGSTAEEQRKDAKDGEPHSNGKDEYEEGIRLNITARMMAVQAPQNWSEHDSSSFFTRHFYRALLQRIFLDKGVFKPLLSRPQNTGHDSAGTSNTAPIIIGTMGKKCYTSFFAYVRGAVAKIVSLGVEIAGLVQEKIGNMDEEEILGYEKRFQERQKELSIVWSLMAFSAGVVEAMVVVDRWVWLMEQECVAEAWVEAVFEYEKSPRNLVIVGIRK